MRKAVIIGFGRFGELFARLSSSIFDLTIIESDRERAQAAKDQGYNIAPIDVAPEANFIFLAVPISEMEQTLIELAPLLSEKNVVADFCSVKVYPIKLMKKYLSKSQIIGMHPMFGPDSAKKGLDGLQVAFCPVRVMPENLQQLKRFWRAQATNVIETTPEEHDKDAVYSQAFTYSLAKIILEMNLPEITFNTRSFNDLTEVAALSANDTEQLFHDMLFYNPYFSEMKEKLGAAIAKTDTILAKIEAEQAELGS